VLIQAVVPGEHCREDYDDETIWDICDVGVARLKTLLEFTENSQHDVQSSFGEVLPEEHDDAKRSEGHGACELMRTVDVFDEEDQFIQGAAVSYMLGRQP
jgi:hypothetical protein